MAAQMKPREISTEELFNLYTKGSNQSFKVCTKITGNHAYGCLLSQLIYQHKFYIRKEFYTIDSKLTEEYSLSAHHLKAGRRCLKDLGILKTKKRSDGRISHSINEERFVQLAEEVGCAYLVERSEKWGGPKAKIASAKSENRFCYIETNNTNKTIKLNNNIREKISVDNSIKEAGQLFVFEKEQSWKMTKEESYALHNLVSRGVNPVPAKNIVLEFTLGEIRNIQESAHREILKGNLRKDEPAYLVGAFNMLRKSKLAAKEAINLIGDNQSRGNK